MSSQIITHFEKFGELKRILAISIGGLGDTILFSPVLMALRNSYPKAHIELLVSNRLAEEVYSRSNQVSSVSYVDFNQPTFILKTASILSFILRTRFNGNFDAGFFATGLNSQIRSIFKYTGIINSVAYAPHPQRCSTDLNCNLELARSIDETASANDVFVPIITESKSEATNLLNEHNISLDNEDIIAVYPSIELIHRPRWQLSKLIKVIQLIKGNGYNGKTVVVGSQIEAAEWAAVDKKKIVDANLAGKLTILGTAALLSKCSLTIGNDGGLMHVAGAVGSPLVDIMANVPFSYRPPGKYVEVIHSKLVCCDGIYPNRPKKCSVAKCTHAIKVQEVYEACLARLSKSQK